MLQLYSFSRSLFSLSLSLFFFSLFSVFSAPLSLKLISSPKSLLPHFHHCRSSSFIVGFFFLAWNIFLLVVVLVMGFSPCHSLRHGFLSKELWVFLLAGRGCFSPYRSLVHRLSSSFSVWPSWVFLLRLWAFFVVVPFEACGCNEINPFIVAPLFLLGLCFSFFFPTPFTRFVHLKLGFLYFSLLHSLCFWLRIAGWN